MSTVLGTKEVGSNEGAFLKQLFSSNGLSLITSLIRDKFYQVKGEKHEQKGR